MSELANAGGKVQCFTLPSTGKTTPLTLSVASNATASLTGGVYRLVSDQDCFVASGASGAVTDMPINAGIPEYFQISDGGTVAAITATGAGTLSITLC